MERNDPSPSPLRLTLLSFFRARRFRENCPSLGTPYLPPRRIGPSIIATRFPPGLFPPRGVWSHFPPLFDAVPLEDFLHGKKWNSDVMVSLLLAGGRIDIRLFFSPARLFPHSAFFLRFPHAVASFSTLPPCLERRSFPNVLSFVPRQFFRNLFLPLLLISFVVFFFDPVDSKCFLPPLVFGRNFFGRFMREAFPEWCLFSQSHLP